MSGITTHVLDTARGRPVANVTVVLERFQQAAWRPVGRATTDADGRARDLVGAAPEPGRYRLTFDTSGHSAFFPEVSVTFVVEAGEEHYHVPLLLSPFGYTTYRGS